MRAGADSLDGAEISFAVAEGATVRAPAMNEVEFRAFYERTAPQLRAYLCRISGNAITADDLLQESYLRLLRAPLAPTEELHRKHYLYRIATNLLRDHFRGAWRIVAEPPEIPSGTHLASDFELQHDLNLYLEQLKPRERELLWLAYVEGYRHDEIAQIVSCSAGSVRPMLFRARRRLAALLRLGGWKGQSAEEGMS